MKLAKSIIFMGKESLKIFFALCLEYKRAAICILILTM